MANPFSDQFGLLTDGQTSLKQDAVEQGTQLAQENLAGQVDQQRQGRYVPSGSPQGQIDQANQMNNQEPEEDTSWSSWNLAKTVNAEGQRKVQPKPQTLQERKQLSLEEVQRKKRDAMLGNAIPEEALAMDVIAESQSPLAQHAAIGAANSDALFNTNNFGGMLGNAVVRAGKSFTDIIDEDIISQNLINNTDQQNASYIRELENQSALTTDRLLEAQKDYADGNEFTAAAKAMGAIVDMGSIMGSSLWNSPGQVLDMLADSAAFFVGGVGAAGRTFGAVRDVSYALRAAKQGVLDYEATHGESPTGDALGRILVGAGASGLLSSASAEILQGRGGMILKRPVDSVMNATANASKAAAQKIINSVAGRTVANTTINAGRIAGGLARDAVAEGSQEIAQEYLETNFMQDRDINPDDVQRFTEAGVGGAAMGGVMTTPRAAMELATSTKDTVQKTNALDVQDAEVRKLLKRSNKKDVTDDERQGLYAEALQAKAKADEQATVLETKQTDLEGRMAILKGETNPEADTANRENREALEADVKNIEDQLAQVDEARKTNKIGPTQIDVAGLGAISIAGAHAELERRRTQLEAMPEAVAEQTPELAQFRQAVAALNPAQRERAITALSSAMGKNTNSLKQYARTKTAADALAKRFKLSDDVRLAEETKAAEAVKVKAEKVEIAKRMLKAKADAEARGEEPDSTVFKPFDPETVAVPVTPEVKVVKTAEGETDYTRRPANLEAPVWDSRQGTEDIPQAVRRLMNEYAALTADADMAERIELYSRMEAMVDMANPEVAASYADVQTGAETHAAVNAVATHLVSGNADSFVTPQAFERMLSNTTPANQETVAKGVYNSLATGPESQLHEFMAKATPQQLADLADKAGLKSDAKAHLIAQGELHKEVASLVKTSDTVNKEIIDTGFDGAGATGERPSILQHDANIQLALNSSKDGEPDYEAARSAFNKLDQWAHDHTNQRSAWIKLLKDHGYADSQTQKEPLSAADRRVLPHTPTEDFYDTLVAEDAIFRATLNSAYQALGDQKDGITEWWLDGLETNRADDTLIREANKKTGSSTYDLANQFSAPLDSEGNEIDQSQFTAGQKANVRKKRSWLQYYGSLKKNKKLFKTFQKTNNLVARAINGTVRINEIDGVEGLGDAGRLSTEQSESWGKFLGFSSAFSEAWKKTIIPGNNNNDLISNFYSQNGKDIDPNVPSILSAVAYDYIATQGSTTLTTDADSMNKIFNTEFAKISQTDRQKMLRDVNGKGIPRAAMVRELGLAGMANFGIQFKHDDAPTDAELDLAGAFGLAIMDTLIAQGVLKTATVKKSDHPGFSSYINSPVITLVHVAKSPDMANKTRKDLADITTAYKQDGNILKLLGGETKAKEMHTTLESLPNHTMTAGGDITLSTEVNGQDGTVEKLAKMNAVPRKYKDHWTNLATALGANVMQALDGFNPDVDLLNVSEAMSVQGSNNQIESNVTDFIDHVTAMHQGRWYVNHTSVSNLRTNIEGYGDYQKNKWIRMAMQNAENGTNTITLVGADGKADADHMLKLNNSFSSYMGGTSEQRTDAAGTTHRTLATVTPEMREVAVNEAIDYLQDNGTFDLLNKASSTGILTFEEQAELTTQLQAFESTYDTETGAELVELAVGLNELHQARLSGKSTFETSFSGEADGTSNGVFFTLVQMGAFETKADAAAGLARYGLTIKDFDGTAEDIAKDIYEYIGAERSNAREEAIKPPEGATENEEARLAVLRAGQTSMDYFIGAADSRGTNKPHTMTTIYSMAMQGQFAEIAKLLEGKVISELSTLASINGAEHRNMAMQETVNHINALLQAQSSKPTDPLEAHEIFQFTGIQKDTSKWTQENFRTMTLKSSVGNKLENYAITVEGPHLETALNKVFGTFHEKSSSLNNIANSIFNVSELARANLTKVALASALDAGDITQAEHDAGFLPQKYGKEVKQDLMDMNLASHMFSAQSTRDKYDTYLPLGSSDIVVDASNKQVGIRAGEGNVSAVSGLGRQRVGPGAGTGAIATHAFDAKDMMSGMANGAMGIHDAYVAPALDLAEHSTNYNRAYYNNLQEYSHLNEASLQLVSMLDGMEALSADNNVLESGPVVDEMTKVYRSVLTSAYKKDAEAIEGLSFVSLKGAVNSYKEQLRTNVKNQQDFTKDLFSSVSDLNQMSITESGTDYVRTGKVRSFNDLVEVEPVTYGALDFLDTDGAPEAVTLQQVIANELSDLVKDINSRTTLASRSDTSQDSEAAQADLAVLQTKRQWLADLQRDLNQALATSTLTRELRTNPDFSVAASVNKVLESAFTTATVLMPREDAQAYVNTIQDTLIAIDEKQKGEARYDNFVEQLGSEGYTDATMFERAVELRNTLEDARAELDAVNTIKGTTQVRETFKTSGTMQVFADLLGDVTNKMNLGDMFKLDESALGEKTSMAKALNASRGRLPAHTRKALEILSTAGAHYFVQVGGKKYEMANGENARNEETRLATEPFIITGNVIQIAPVSFKHSPFNDPANMSRLAAALQLDVEGRSDTALIGEQTKLAIDALGRFADPQTQRSGSTAIWAKGIMKSYMTNAEVARAFDGVDSRAKEAKEALGIIAKALNMPYDIARLGANTEVVSDTEIWADAAKVKAEAEKTIDESQVKQENGKGLGSIAGDTAIPVDKFTEIEGANLADTLTMLDETYGADDKEHVTHLKGLMGIMGQAVNKIKLGIAEATGAVQQGVYDTGYISLQLFKAKDATKTSKLISTGHVQSAAEIFAHEATHAGTVFALDNNTALYNEANALWQEVRDAKDAEGNPLFDYTMFMPEGVTADTDNATAQFVREKIFNHIFEVKNDPRNGNKSPHVAEFIAYASTNARFRNAIKAFEEKAKVAPEVPTPTNFLGKIQNVFNKVVDFITRKTDTTDGKLIDRIDALTIRLAANDAKHKGGLMVAADVAATGATKVFDLAAKATQKSMQAMGAGLTAIPVDAVSNTGKIVSRIANGNMQVVMDGLDAGYDKLNKANHNWLASMVSESLGRRKYELTTRRDIRKMTAASDAMRQNIQDSVASAINSSFTKPLEEWDVADQRAMTDVLLRNDLATLAYTDSTLNSINTDLLKDLLSDPTKVDRHIAQLTNELMNITGVTATDQAFYVRSARTLGAFMATGKVVDDLLVNNATAIALKHGTVHNMIADKASIQAHSQQIKIIDQLASLHALRFTDANVRNRVAEIMDAEPNGVAMLLSSHHANKNDSAETQFKDAPTLMLKGYMPATTSKNIELRLAPTKDQTLLESQGWQVNSQLERDKADKVNTDMQYYTRKTVGTTYNKGGFDLTSMAARGLAGTKISTMSPREAKALGVKNAQAVAQRSKSVKNMFRSLSTKDTLTDSEIMSGKVPNRMAPTLDAEGNIVEYRYLVPNGINDAVLHRDPNPANVMAKAHGQTKQRSTLVTNTTPLVSTLKLVFDNLSEAKKDTTVTISENSSDERGREVYRMLPAYIKAEIKDVWGRGGMKVPAAMMDPVFGNRSLQIESWLREPKTAQGLSAITHEAMKGLFGNNVAYKAGYMQETIQDMVGQAKSAIIVKSAEVLGMNVLSNTALLIGMGVPPSSAIHYYREAIPETRRYQRDTEEMFAIDMKISAMSAGERFLKGEQLQQRKARLVDALARNPMHELMEAGAYVNIATQMGVSANQIAEDETWMGKIRTTRENHLPDVVNKVIDEALLTENSDLYRAAVVGAQMTDFAARYALVQHLTKVGAATTGATKRRKYTTTEAIDSAMDVFVDFTGATSPELQLANDLGLVMFSKYRLRVANSIMAAAEINPKGVLGLSVMDMALKATELTGGTTVVTGKMGITGLLSSLQTPWETMSHIADNTLFSYLPSR
ncbi:hypothetical protein OAP32_00645 [Crocinitomicaceae bacterium]|nr:hypothetical protein [Crocinitomicaceae bacterium]